MLPKRKTLKRPNPNRAVYMTVFRAKRLANGLCQRCGEKPHRPGKKTCGCDNKYQQERTVRLAKEKVCRRCPKSVKGNFQLCPRCRKNDVSRKVTLQQRRLKEGLCIACGNNPHLEDQKWCKLCCDKAKKHALKVRIEVFEHYGGAFCMCCGEREVNFLTIDHIHGVGTSHRKTMGIGRSIYTWLKARGLPAGYQVLCFNCNCGRKIDGVCPHKIARRS